MLDSCRYCTVVCHRTTGGGCDQVLSAFTNGPSQEILLQPQSKDSKPPDFAYVLAIRNATDRGIAPTVWRCSHFAVGPVPSAVLFGVA